MIFIFKRSGSINVKQFVRISSEQMFFWKKLDENKYSFVQFDEKTYVRFLGKNFPQAVDKPVENC